VGKAFIDMTARSVAQQCLTQFGPAEQKEVWIHFVQTGTPEELLTIAQKLRGHGEMQSAYHLEYLADMRTRGLA
jgi:hypothetical protein